MLVGCRFYRTLNTMLKLKDKQSVLYSSHFDITMQFLFIHNEWCNTLYKCSTT